MAVVEVRVRMLESSMILEFENEEVVANALETPSSVSV